MAEKFSRKPEQTRRARALRQTATATERRLWLVLSRNQMGVSFRRQHPAGPYFLDYYCPALRLAIEVDGDWHDAGADARRDASDSRVSPQATGTLRRSLRLTPTCPPPFRGRNASGTSGLFSPLKGGS